VPPPIAALAGNIGERHVLIFVGLPLVGKRTIALRLKRYLRFFHGAKCKAFDIAKFTPPSSNGGNGAMSPMSPMDANAHAHDFFDTLRNFLEGSDDKPANGQGGAAMEVDNVANATATAAARRASVNGVDPVDRNAKNVDSGRVAIIFSSDCMSTFYENWSGSSKERRRWILSSLATLSDTSKSKIRVKTIFIEVTLTKDGLVDNILEQKLLPFPDVAVELLLKDGLVDNILEQKLDRDIREG
jgi:DNA polymerase III delta prime subunit